MKWFAGCAVFALTMLPCAIADAGGTDPPPTAGAETVTDAVRVTVVRSGGVDAVVAVRGGSAGSAKGCGWSLRYSPDLDDVPYGVSAGPPPDPEARFALLLCDGLPVGPIWVSPSDVVDLDALARNVAQRYVRDVLVPEVRIGVNPAPRGLVGFPSWFWVEGFTGSVTAPPITAFGLTIDVRMSSGPVRWDFGDGTRVRGDLGRAYPTESTVQHIHQQDGDFTVSAVIGLEPEYRVNDGPWVTLPALQASASTTHEVQERQAVITKT